MVNIGTDTLSYAGIGNIEARVIGSEVSLMADSPTGHDYGKTDTSTKGSYQLNTVLRNIGNTKKALHLMSMNGIVGYNLKKVKVFEYPYRPGDIVVMFSDGISSRIDLFEFLPKEDLQAAAQMILERHGKNDDATILLAQRPVTSG